jgi:ArsR family metal-binding transcriptional regulator
MLLAGYTLEIFKSKCQAEALGVHCYAHLEDDISEVLPYLNTVLGGFVYTNDPPSLTLKASGKLITLHPQKIAINALRDREEAEKIAAWLQREINETWDKRADIKPSTKSAQQPVLMEIFKLLPRTNCRECGEPTCLVFAARAVEGVKDQNDCPPISVENKEQLREYLSGFSFE